MPGQTELDQRAIFLKQQVKDLEDQLRKECISSVNARVQLMQRVVKAEKSLQFEEEVVKRLSLRIIELQSAYEAQRRAADRLQQMLNSRAAQNQQEDALKDQIGRLRGQVREQKESFAKARTQFIEQRRVAEAKREQLEKKVEQLENRLQGQDVLPEEEERARVQRLQDQATNNAEARAFIDQERGGTAK